MEMSIRVVAVVIKSYSYTMYSQNFVPTKPYLLQFTGKKNIEENNVRGRRRKEQENTLLILRRCSRLIFIDVIRFSYRIFYKLFQRLGMSLHCSAPTHT